MRKPNQTHIVIASPAREMRLHVTTVFCRDRSYNLASTVQAFDSLERIYAYLDDLHPGWMSFTLTVLP